MDDLRKSAAYLDLIGRADIDPAVTDVVEIEIEGFVAGAVPLRRGQSLDIDGASQVRFEEAESAHDLELPPGTSLIRHWTEPVSAPRLSPVPCDIRSHRLRLRDLREWLSEMGGSIDLSGNVKSGWLPIIEALISAIVAVIDDGDRVTLAVGTAHGRLFIEPDIQCSDHAKTAFLSDLVDWAAAVAATRCPCCGNQRAVADEYAADPIALQRLPEYCRPAAARISGPPLQGSATQRLVAAAGRLFEIAIATEAEVNALPAELGLWPPPGLGYVTNWRVVRLRDMELGRETLNLLASLDGSGPWLSGPISVFTEHRVVRAGGSHFIISDQGTGTYEGELDRASQALIATLTRPTIGVGDK